MTKLVEVMENIKPEFKKVKEYLNKTEENIENYSHEDLCDRFTKVIDPFLSMLEQILEAYENAPESAVTSTNKHCTQYRLRPLKGGDLCK